MNYRLILLIGFTISLAVGCASHTVSTRSEITTDHTATAASPTWDAPRGLEFLRTDPEVRGVDLGITEEDFLALMKSRSVNLREDRRGTQHEYSVPCHSGDTIYVGFTEGLCTGIQRGSSAGAF
jgi:hypothetical protein